MPLILPQSNDLGRSEIIGVPRKLLCLLEWRRRCASTSMLGMYSFSLSIDAPAVLNRRIEVDKNENRERKLFILYTHPIF